MAQDGDGAALATARTPEGNSDANEITQAAPQGNGASIITKADAEEFTQALGQIAGGTWRQIALAKRMGVPAALGLTVDEWVQQRLGGYIRMAVEDRRDAVKELAAEGYKQRDIGKILGVDQKTVSNDLRDEENSSTAHKEPAQSPKPIKPDEENSSPPNDAPKQIRQAQNTGEMEWFTPIPIIESARAVLSGIDLNPASCPSGQRNVRAARFFTKADDGLKHEWRGRVWLNPPYSQPAIAHFVSKLVAEYRACNVKAAILLTNDCCDTAWFHEAGGVASAVCFPKGRICFERPDGTSGQPLQGQAIFFFGEDVQRFMDESRQPRAGDDFRR